MGRVFQDRRGVDIAVSSGSPLHTTERIAIRPYIQTSGWDFFAFFALPIALSLPKGAANSPILYFAG